MGLGRGVGCGGVELCWKWKEFGLGGEGVEGGGGLGGIVPSLVGNTSLGQGVGGVGVGGMGGDSSVIG